MANEKLVYITVIYRTGTNQSTGETFRKATVKGRFLNTEAVNHTLPIDHEARYVVRGADNLLKDHKRDGKYRLYFEPGSCWIDERPDKIESHIIRVKDVKIVEWRGALAPRLGGEKEEAAE